MPPARFNSGQVSGWGKSISHGGTTGQVLAKSADSDYTTGWENRAVGRGLHVPTSLFFISPYLSAVDSTQALALNALVAYPLFIDTAVTFDRVAIEVTNASASSTIRIGLYRSSATGSPSSLIQDFGTVDSTGTGSKEITINLSLTPGLYFVSYVAQGGTPTVRARTANFPFFGNATLNNNANVFAINDTAARSGALPDPFGTIAYLQNNLAKVVWRIA